MNVSIAAGYRIHSAGQEMDVIDRASSMPSVGHQALRVRLSLPLLNTFVNVQRPELDGPVARTGRETLSWFIDGDCTDSSCMTCIASELEVVEGKLHRLGHFL